MSDNILFSFLLGFIFLIFILIVGINIKNKKVRYNSIKCLEAEKNLLMQKIEFNKQHLNEDPINLQNTIYEDNIRVNSINDEIFWRYVHYMALGYLLAVIFILSIIYILKLS